MDAVGFVAVCRDCKVLAKDSFTAQDGRTIYMATVMGFGFTKKFIAQERDEWELWPPAGTEVDIQCQLESQAAGLFKLVSPTFQPKKSKAA